MLKTYACVACERVILAKDDVPSLISLFTKMVVEAPTGVEIPPDAVAPKEWAIFSAWIGEPGDENIEYILHTQLLRPDQTQFGEVLKMKIPIERGKRSQMHVRFNAFPLGQLGNYTVHSWVETNRQRVVDPIEITLELELIRTSATASASQP